jgi:alcohol dehydrogenase (cytochrome c)
MNRAVASTISLRVVGSAALSCALASTAAGDDEARPGARIVPHFVPVTDEYLRAPSPDDWMMARGRYEMWGYSALGQIDRDNVRNLTLVWARAMRQEGINQGAPLVYDGIMYLPNPWDQVQAIDAASGDLIWEYSPAVPPPEARTGAMNWGQRQRSVFLWDDKLYMVSALNRVIALDARSGEVVWETSRGDEGIITNTSGPIVVDGVVIAGGQCQAAPRGCYVTGHDAETGEELWRHEVIPKPGEPGDETWGNTPYERRWCTGVWGQIIYDPEHDLVHYGTSATCPASEIQRDAAGATLAGTNTRFAVRPATGEVVWQRQVLPRDNWDLECTLDMMVIDSPVNPNPGADAMIAANADAGGADPRRTLTGMPCKVPVFWSLDSASGEFFYAKATWDGAQTIYTAIDPKTGEPSINEEIILREIGVEYMSCPSYGGGRTWFSGAYDPERNIIVQPTIDRCALTSPVDRPDGIEIGHGYNVRHVTIPNPANPSDNIGRLTAVNVETGDTVWAYEQRAGNYSPALATAGGLLFNGGGDRYLRAHDLDTGDVLWRTRLGSGGSGHTVSYAVDGRQYIAIVAGAAAGAGDLHPEIDGVAAANMVYVFALPERADER